MSKFIISEGVIHHHVHEGLVVKQLPGYPTYPVGEDIYEQDKEDKEINPEQITTEEELSENSQKDFDEDSLDSGLDIPGSELDDEQEKIGSEDEENNYYSLGDDNGKE
jgi:hypothetical protein